MDAVTKENFPLDNFCARYFMLAPVQWGIAILGADEVYNGTKAITAVEPIGERAVFLEVAYESTLRFYIPQSNTPATVQATLLDGKSLPVRFERNLSLIPNAPKGHIILHY
ncbi:MAG: hypothetical protein RBG13Loki_0915 [Promethearchaeota archaeon CR_4]|nr:MAG: hypothetical protein RBG13Loki_0915 [Candidatus Lokiarchaeota archaeon CR_4]